LDYYLSEKKITPTLSADYTLSPQESFKRANRIDIRYVHLLRVL